MQETLLRAWRHPEVLDQSQRSARAWLFTVARRLVIDDRRSRRSRLEVSTEVPPDTVEAIDWTDRVLQSWVLAEALDQLSAEHREVLLEGFYRVHGVAQSADRLGVPPGTVKSRTYYALRSLRLVLQEMGEIR